MREAWLAQENADLTEGRGPMVTKAAFFNREDAVRAAKGLRGVMGIGAGEVAALPLEVWESFTEYEHGRDEAVRVRALAKLTPDERRALGISSSTL